MKRILYLFALLVTVSTTAKAETNTIAEADASINNLVRGYGNSFIFIEGGIEFAVFPDGQFDFYMPNYGPNVNIGINSPNFALSFNTGFNYNPYVQYDSFGAIIQIENTPIFYDAFGRVNQIGNIIINYNGIGRVSRIGGLQLFYRNNVFWRHTGFINIYNRAYVWRPWHRFYALPPANFCVINTWPYRQFYTPVRHVWYRPYRNNIRHFNINGRRGSADFGRRNANRVHQRYAQQPRTRADYDLRRRVERRNTEIRRTRSVGLANNASIDRTRNSRNNRSAVTRNATRTTANTFRRNSSSERSQSIVNSRTRSNTRVTKPKRATRSNVARTNSRISNNRTASVRKPKATSNRRYNRTSSMSKNQRSVVRNDRKAPSVRAKSSISRNNNKSNTRTNSRRSRY
jgi:hypothetical protein